MAPPPSLAVLLVEDDPVHRLVVRRLLEKRGHAVLPAGDGVEALAMLATVPVDAVLLDVQLPGVDGLEIVRRIRAGEAGSADVPVIALTSWTQPAEQQRCLAAGMDACLPKPVPGDVLVRALHAVIARRGERTV